MNITSEKWLSLLEEINTKLSYKHFAKQLFTLNMFMNKKF